MRFEIADFVTNVLMVAGDDKTVLIDLVAPTLNDGRKKNRFTRDDMLEDLAKLAMVVALGGGH